MRSVGRLTTFGAILFSFLWAGSALGNEARPKNVIILIGDGMGPEQVESARLLDPDGVLAMDEVDSEPGFANTDNAFGEVTDSAAAGTALATGQKSYNGAVSVDVDGKSLVTSFEIARANGKATGILSDVYMCDATPGVWLAHATRRSCSDIIPQQVVSDVGVFLGAGRTIAYASPRKNAHDFIEEMAEYGDYEVVGNNAEELAAAQAPNDKLLGIWNGYTVTYNIDRQNDDGLNDPTLAQMTAKAIEVLSRDPDGFFLMVEGGALDWMAHNRDIAGVARDTVAFDEAVAVAYDFASDDGDTLVVVTADHECGGLVVGDSPNVEFIAGITASTDFMYGLVMRGEMSAEEVLETYAGVAWDDLTAEEKQGVEDYGEMGISDVLTARANVEWGWSGRDEGNHTATEVPVYAFGPGSEHPDWPLESHIDNTHIGNLLLWAAGKD